MPSSRPRQRILIVEDDADIRDALKLAFEFEAYDVSLARDPSEAVTLIHEITFNLILTDLFGSQPINLLDSITALRDQAHPTPVGVMTGWMVDPDVAANLGFTFLVRKPFDLNELISRVAAAIDAPLTKEQRAQAETVIAYFQLLSARDWDRFVALCTEDVIYVLPGISPFAGTIEGRVAFREYTSQTFAQFPETRFENIHVYATPAGLAARYKGTWAQPDGSRAAMTGAAVFQFAGRLIRHIGVRQDDARLSKLLGGATA